MTNLLSTELNAANIAKVLEILAESPSRLAAVSKAVSAETLSQPMGNGERTPTEALAHVLNGEAPSAEMIYQALLVYEPYFPDLHPDRDLGKLLRFDLLNFAELLAYFNVRRKVLLRVLSGLSEAQWARSIQEEGKKRRNQSIGERGLSSCMSWIILGIWNINCLRKNRGYL